MCKKSVRTACYPFRNYHQEYRGQHWLAEVKAFIGEAFDFSRSSRGMRWYLYGIATEAFDTHQMLEPDYLGIQCAQHGLQ